MRKFGYLVMIGCLALGSGWRADATNLIFKNGQQLPNARIIVRTDKYLSVAVANGIVHYPLSSVASIDGRPFVEDDETSKEATVPAPAPYAIMPGPISLPSPSATPAPSVKAAVPAQQVSRANNSAPDRWNFEFFLIGFLLLSGVWMRSLQAVQRDLFERRAQPGAWTMAALLLPGLGAAAYFATLRIRKAVVTFKSRQYKSEPAPAPNPLPANNSGTGLSYRMAAPKNTDPAAYLARKGTTRQGLTFLDTDRKSVAIHGNGDISSGLDNASEMLEEALLEKASDIHIEPASDSYRVRFRLDGVLHERMSYETSGGVRVVTALKSLAEIDVAEKRRAQDGKFRVRAADREVDFRVATANSIYGEKMVIRVLDHQGGIFDLTSLGMSDEMLAAFQKVIHSKNGMILATGPTGSGKTSTLYAALRQLDGKQTNIMTIEDPAEYELKGITQIAVNTRAGITYEAGLRSILRQDPDVILVGEMRDAEASSVALRAALTGHLVLSTLHTRDAIGTISRLQDMGIERYQLASALLMVIAQRLVRVLCPECKQEYPAAGNELESLGFSFDPGQPIYAAQGCDACLGTGFRGRTGLFELLVLDDEFRQAIGDGADEAALTELALQRGFKSYRYDGAEKVLLGVTTVDEVLESS